MNQNTQKELKKFYNDANFRNYGIKVIAGNKNSLLNEKAKVSNPNLFVSDHVYVCENGVTNNRVGGGG